MSGGVLTSTSSLGQRNKRPRAFRAFLTYLVLAAILVSLFLPLLSLEIYKSNDPRPYREETFDKYSQSTPSACPVGWSRDRCQQRWMEFSKQLTVHEQIRGEMMQAARRRAQRNVYRRHQPQLLRQEYVKHLERVENVVRSAPGNNTSSIPHSAPWANFSGNSFADISILGFPKAGTSQLFKLLVSHPGATPVFKRKEYCMDHGHFLDYTLPQTFENVNAIRDLRKKLFQYHKHLFNLRTYPNYRVRNDTGQRLLLVNACLQPQELEYHMAYTPMPESSRYILLFRDPADWLWATWNFWIDKNLDARPPVDHDWASIGVHYRSPELFHELILSQEATMTAARRFRSIREQTVHVPRRLVNLVGPERVLFVKSEDMKASNGHLPQFLQRISNFTGLSSHEFDSTVAHGQTNCNANKGFQNLCNASESTSTTESRQGSGGYPISHYRPMLQETRQLIYLQFWEECNIWAEEFDVVYHDCLNALIDESGK